MGAVLKFPPIRGAELQQGKTACSVRPIVSRISAGSRYGFYHGPVTAKVSLPEFVVICRYQAPATGETGAYCANLSSLTIRGAITDDLMNSFRALVPGNLLPSGLLKSFQESCSRGSDALKSFRGLVLRHVSEHDIGVTQNDGTIVQERGFFSQGAGRV